MPSSDKDIIQRVYNEAATSYTNISNHQKNNYNNNLINNNNNNNNNNNKTSSIPFRNYNNFVKKIIIQKAMEILLLDDENNNNLNNNNNNINNNINWALYKRLLYGYIYREKMRGNIDIFDRWNYLLDNNYLINNNINNNNNNNTPTSPEDYDMCSITTNNNNNSNSPPSSDINNNNINLNNIINNNNNNILPYQYDGYIILDVASGRGGDLLKWLMGQYPAINNPNILKIMREYNNNNNLINKNNNYRGPPAFIFPKEEEEEDNIDNNNLNNHLNNNNNNNKLIPILNIIDHPTFVSRVISIDISPGAVLAAVDRYKEFNNNNNINNNNNNNNNNIMRGDREMASASFYIGNCLDAGFWIGSDDNYLNNNNNNNIIENNNNNNNNSPIVPIHNINSMSELYKYEGEYIKKCHHDNNIININNNNIIITPIDIISCQFAFHYACQTVDNIKGVLMGMLRALTRNKCNYLINNNNNNNNNNPMKSPSLGVLVITTINAAKLTEYMRYAYNNNINNNNLNNNNNYISDVKVSKTVVFSNKLFEIHLPLFEYDDENNDNLNNNNNTNNNNNNKRNDSREIERILSWKPCSSTELNNNNINNNINNINNNNNNNPPILPLGTIYHFYIDGHVDCSEYVIPHDDFINIATCIECDNNNNINIFNNNNNESESEKAQGGENPHRDDKGDINNNNNNNNNNNINNINNNKYIFKFHSSIPFRNKEYMDIYTSSPKVRRELNNNYLTDDERELLELYSTYIFIASCK